MNGSWQEDVSNFDEERKEFVKLTQRMVDVIVDFCLLTLRAIGRKKQTPLNSDEIDKIIEFHLQFTIQQLQDPELLDIIKEKAFSKFEEIQKRF